MIRANRLKKRLLEGQRATGCWVFLAGGDSTELLSHCGFDAFIVDHEHIGADLRTLVEQMRAAQAGDTALLCRVPSHDPVYIKRVLDAGVDGVVVPTLETAAQARAGVDNLDEILQVDGLDMIISGPGDLAADVIKDFSRLTEYGSHADPELEALMARIEARTRAAGRWLGGVARQPAAAPALYAKGSDFVTLTADIWLLGDGARRALAEGAPRR